jgi:hypothetical protein
MNLALALAVSSRESCVAWSVCAASDARSRRSASERDTPNLRARPLRASTARLGPSYSAVRFGSPAYLLVGAATDSSIIRSLAQRSDRSVAWCGPRNLEHIRVGHLPPATGRANHLGGQVMCVYGPGFWTIVAVSSSGVIWVPTHWDSTEGRLSALGLPLPRSFRHPPSTVGRDPAGKEIQDGQYAGLRIGPSSKPGSAILSKADSPFAVFAETNVREVGHSRSPGESFR